MSGSLVFTQRTSSVAELVQEYQVMGHDTFAEQCSPAALLGIGRLKNVEESDERTLSERTMTVSYLGDGQDEADVDFHSLQVGTALPSIGVEPALITGMVWFIRRRKTPMSVGRNTTCDISIAEKSISAQHCALQWTGPSSLSLLAIGRTNPVWVAQRSLPPDEPLELEGRELIVLGMLQFRFVYAAGLTKMVQRNVSPKAAEAEPSVAKGGLFARLFGRRK